MLETIGEISVKRFIFVSSISQFPTMHKQTGKTINYTYTQVVVFDGNRVHIAQISEGLQNSLAL